MKRIVRLFSIALALGFLSHGVPAQTPDIPRTQKIRKPAWQWTLAERLAARFDPAAMKARQARRLAEHEAHQAARRARGVPEDPIFDHFEPSPDSIEGKENPELFLPHELFNFLLITCFPPEGDLFSRGRIEQRAPALGLGSDFWSRLGKISEPLLDLDSKRHKLAMEAIRSGAEVPEVEGPYLRCRLRADALSAAKAEFGEEVFLRLLYEAVAPSIGISGSPDQDMAELDESLRYQEGGCR